ncbi:MAG: ATP-binding protein, partial [Pedobacter sp.]
GREGTDGQHSVGLGMWIIKRFVDAHQGRVWFETKEKVGTKFFVELPL